MKTRLVPSVLTLALASSVAPAQNRPIPADPGADTGNTGAAGAGTSLDTRAPSKAQDPDFANPRVAVPSDSPVSNPGRVAVNPGPSTRSATSDLPRDQRRFFEKLGRLNEQEKQLSRLAAQSANTPQVRAFASDLLAAHSAHGELLADLATRKGATLRPADPRHLRDTEKDWADKKGRDLDKAYLEAVIEAHEDSLDVLENGARSKDPEIAALANKMLPDLTTHLDRARDLANALN
jgi:putative membrane protein